MFNKKNPVEYNNVNTIIGEDCCFEGLFNSSGSIRIDGTVKGEIKVSGNLYVGENGKVLGNIKGLNIFIAGEVQGNVFSDDQLRISTTGRLYGDVNIKTFILDENATFEGNCKMHKQVATEEKLTSSQASA